jgi:hypothetical protein
VEGQPLSVKSVSLRHNHGWSSWSYHKAFNLARGLEAYRLGIASSRTSFSAPAPSAARRMSDDPESRYRRVSSVCEPR